MNDEGQANGLLLACLRHDGPGDAVRTSRSEDVRRMLVLASLHGVGPILYKKLGALVAAGLTTDEDVERELRNAYYHSRLRSIALRPETAAVLRAITARGISVVALKGAYLAEHVYADDALRPRLDLDVLVPTEQADAAAAAVLALGYRWDDSIPTSGPNAVDYTTLQHLRRLMHPERVPVEIHRALTRRDVPWWIEPADLWRRAQPTRIAGADALALSPEHLLLHLVVHAASHQFAVPLLALEDIAVVGEQLVAGDTWPSFVETANAARAGGLAYATLALARMLLAADIPDETLRRLDHGPGDDAIVSALARTVLDQFASLPVAYERSLAASGTWARLSTLVRGIVPAPSRLREEHRLSRWSPAIAWYYLRRPFDLMRRHGRTLGRLFTPGRYASGRVAVERWLRP